MLPTLSRLSVSIRPGSRLRHRCSSEYLRISPLHSEFHFPLRYSSLAVSSALQGLSPRLSRRTCKTAYTRFTPSNSEQRSHSPYYRGCWTELASASSSGTVAPQLPTAFVPPDRALQPEGLHHPRGVLRQAFAHCAIFPTAASRRSLDRVPVPVWLIVLSDQLTIVAMVGLYPAIQLMVRGPVLRQRLPRDSRLLPHQLPPIGPHAVLASPSARCPPPKGALPTCYSPVRRYTHPEGLSRSTCMC